MEMKDLVLGAAGNCEVCNNKKTEGYLITEPGAHPFWVCPECFKAYRSLKKKLERIGAAFPTGRNIQKAILLRRDYLAAVSLGNQSIEFYKNGKFEEALQGFLNAINVCREQDEVEDYSALLGNIATIYTDLGRFEEALNIHIEEEAICRRMGLDSDLGVCHFNKGRLFERMGKLSDALEFARSGVEILTRTGKYADTLKQAKSMVGRLS